jgi:hypothetical protein
MKSGSSLRACTYGVKSAIRGFNPVTKKKLSIQDFARMGGKARGQKLSKKQLSDQARKAVQARWKKARKKESS